MRIKRLKYGVANKYLYYNPETGAIISKSTGRDATRKHSGGYFSVRIEGESYLAHRIAWLLYHKENPSNIMDHENGDKRDNRLCNLRVATPLINMQNKKIYKNTPTGINNTCFIEGKNKYRARITVNKIAKHLGYFDNFFDACCARKSAENQYGFHDNHGMR